MPPLQLNLSLIMVLVFLTLILTIGMYYSGKITSLREYAIGNKRFSTSTLVTTSLAAYFGGGTLIHTVEKVYGQGLYFAVTVIIGSFTYWLMNPLALRMGPFMDHISPSETIGSVYGKYPRVITALSCILTSIFRLTIQIRIFYTSIAICLGLAKDNEIIIPITVVVTLLLILYSSFGGIRAVTSTDVIQFITFSMVIPLLTWFVFQSIGKPFSEIVNLLQSQKKFHYGVLLHFDRKMAQTACFILASTTVSTINPTHLQRLYMASSPIQARKVTFYTGIFSLLIKISIVLLGAFTVVSAPELTKNEIWLYIISHIPPYFKGLLCISLIAMTMSTANSKLNSCGVMFAHDVIGSIGSKKSFFHITPLWIAKISSLFIGTLAMLLALTLREDVLGLFRLIFNYSIPIFTAPFILAVLGFRGSSCTALTGMATGILAILSWNKWIAPDREIDGSFPSMVANGLAMMASHYLLPRQKGTGWVGTNNEFKKIQQSNTRRKEIIKATKEIIKTTFSDLLSFLEKFKPTSSKLIGIGLYIIITSFFILGTIGVQTNVIHWIIFQLIAGSCFLGCGIFIPPDKYSGWIAGLFWLIGLIFCLTLNTFVQLWHVTTDLLTLTLITNVIHLAVALWVFPLYLDMPLVVLILIGSIAISYSRAPDLWPSGFALFSLVGAALMLFFLIMYMKFKINFFSSQIYYLKNKQKIKNENRIKNLAYNLNFKPSTLVEDNSLATDSAILEQVVKDITQSISFLDDNPLYKQDFESIINKFSEWAIFLKKQAKSKEHILLLSNKVGLDELLHKLEVSLERELGKAPRLLIVKEDNTLPSHIVCDENQMISLLFAAVLQTINLDQLEDQFIKLQLYSTHLQYPQNDLIHPTSPGTLTFPAVAVLISNSNIPPSMLPIVQNNYEYIAHTTLNSPPEPMCIDLEKRKIERIIYAHYGYLEMINQAAILLVLPWNVSHIRDEMFAKLPIEYLTSEGLLSSKEESDSMVILMEFHELVCNMAYVDPGVIGEILLLLRRCYGFKRHPCGQLFYVRAVGIAKLVATWIFHSPKPIYAALLYDLVRYTLLPLSYIKANYDMGIFYFVEAVLHVDRYQDQHTEISPFYIGNRFKKAISKDQLSVLYIKLAERLYDLRHASGYTNMKEVKHMVKETLAIDLKIAIQYLEKEISIALESAAKEAWTFYQKKTHLDDLNKMISFF